jgi:hypothetical protein
MSKGVMREMEERLSDIPDPGNYQTVRYIPKALGKTILEARHPFARRI